MPSSDDLLSLFDSVRAVYGKMLAEFEEDEKYINAPWDPSFATDIIPESWEDDGLEVTVPPTVYNAVEGASDHILTTPRVSVPIRPTTRGIEKQRDIAETRRHFHELAWHRTFEDCGDPLGRGKKHLIKGKIVLKHEIVWDLIPELDDDPTPAQKRRFRRELMNATSKSFPWRLTLVPKETVFEDPSAPWDPAYVFESYETRVIDVRSRFHGNEAVERALKDRDATSMVTYTEYWSKPGYDPEYPDGQFVQWIERTVIHEDDNPYPYVPYAIGDPGWGDVTAKNNPEDRYVSIVRPIRKVAKAETRFLTEMESYLRMYIWPVLLTKNMPDLSDGENPLTMGPGAHRDLTEEQEMDLLKWGEMPLSLLQGMQRVNQYADESSRFGALSGIPQRGVDTATEADQNVRNAATKLSGPVRTLKRLCQLINRWREMDIELVFEAPVTIYGALDSGPSEATLKPTDINGFYATSVEMETSDEASLNLRNARTWSDLYQRLPVSAYTVLKRAGVANPTEEMNERVMEDLERSEQMQQVALTMMLLGQGEVAQPVLQAFQQSLAQNQTTGQGGNQPGNAGAAPVNGVEANRQQARDAAIQNQPERSFF